MADQADSTNTLKHFTTNDKEQSINICDNIECNIEQNMDNINEKCNDNNITNPNPCAITSKPNNINVLSWNIQGIGSKLELASILNFSSKYEIIFLFETMKLNSFEPSLQGYQYIHCQRQYQHPRARRPSGGIAVLIKK